MEKRERSGVYVAALDRRPGEPLVETAEWLTGVLTDAFHHRVRVPYLPELLRRWTAAVPLRCACVESDEDSSAALCAEVSNQFGLEAVPVELRGVAGHAPDADRVPEDVRNADILLTTALHAEHVRPWAEALNKPLLVAAMSPEHVDAIEDHLRTGTLTTVCMDPGFGERVRRLHTPWDPERIRVVLAENAEAVGALDPEEPVLLTRAARERLGPVSLRLLVPLSFAFCPEFARSVAETLIRLNIECGRF